MSAQDMEIIHAVFAEQVIREGFGKIYCADLYPLITPQIPEPVKSHPEKSAPVVRFRHGTPIKMEKYGINGNPLLTKTQIASKFHTNLDQISMAQSYFYIPCGQ